MSIISKKIQWGGKKLSLQTGKFALRARSSVIATYGGTTVLCVVSAKDTPSAFADFLPLSVHYTEKYYAAGKIPGGFFKREGRPTEREVLISRLIDRPIRPLFPKWFFNEIQVMLYTLAYDGKEQPDVVALIAASAALKISGLPFLGPIGAVRVSFIDNKLCINPTIQETETADLDLVMAGTKEGVLMVESEANQLSEKDMLKAVNFGHKNYQKIISFVDDFAKNVEVEKQAKEIKVTNKNLLNKVVEQLTKKLSNKINKALTEKSKNAREEALAQLKEDSLLLIEKMFDGEKEEKDKDFVLSRASLVFKTIESKILRDIMFDSKNRIDGRKFDEIRHIATEINLFPANHGSALFTRGETQALAVATLGTDREEQIIDDIIGDRKESFMLHYNFPMFSVGEVGRVGATSRREIGHGKLAWRAIHPLLPKAGTFPYSIRVVSEVLSSNGSSSMATVCASSMAMMATGIPLTSPCAGIAMGLIKEGDDFIVLSDILGEEDHLGDMDFKVAGTHKGITSLQMDIKITSITPEIMELALKQAKKGREHILGKMAKTIEQPSEQMPDSVPKVKIIEVPVDQIKYIIGSGGKVIKELSETYSVKIDIKDDGQVKIFGEDMKLLLAAIKKIKSLVQKPELNKEYEGRVVKTFPFGVKVNIMKKYDGLLHSSNIKSEKEWQKNYRMGKTLKVKVIAIENGGKISFSVE